MLGPTFTVTVMSFVCAVVPVLRLAPAVPMPAAAVTLAVRVVVSVVVATPLGAVFAVDGLTAPTSDVNETGTPGSALPLVSTTLAEIVDEPPLAGSVDGLAVRAICPTAALPTAIRSAFTALTDDPPDEAVI